MSSAPPGWHRQDDGRERFWDGESWTDEFRDPSSAETQQIPVGETQGMPSGQPQDQSGYAGAGSSGYASPPPGGHREEYPREPYYGQDAPLSDKPGGMPGWLKGCLFALLAVVLLAAVAIGVGWWLVNRTLDQATDPDPVQSETVAPTQTEEPTDDATGGPTLPTQIPTTLPTQIPTTLPTVPGVGETVQVSIGEGFTFGQAEIQQGWTIEDESLGFKSVSMRVVPQEASTVPLVFTMRFLSGSEELSTTICTVPLTAAGQEEDAVCVPMRGDAQSADEVEVSGLGSG